MDKWDLLLEYLQLVGAVPEDVLDLVADKFAENTADYRKRMHEESTKHET
jgi:hypothetical protein